MAVEKQLNQQLHLKRFAPHLFPIRRRRGRCRPWTHVPSPLSMSDNTDGETNLSEDYNSSLEYTDRQPPNYSRQQVVQYNDWSSSDDSSAYVEPPYSGNSNPPALPEASFSSIGSENVHESYCIDFGQVQLEQPQADSPLALKMPLPAPGPSTTRSGRVNTQSAHLAENVARPRITSSASQSTGLSLATIQSLHRANR